MSDLIRLNILKRIKAKSKNSRFQIQFEEREDNKEIFIKITTKRLVSREKRTITEMSQILTFNTFITLMQMTNFAMEDKKLQEKIGIFLSTLTKQSTSIWNVNFTDKKE